MGFSVTRAILIMTALSTLGLLGCGSNSNSNSGQPGLDSSFEKAAQVRCQNSIAVDDSGASASASGAQGHYRLKAAQLFVVSSSGDSLAASSNARDGFKLKVDCNGVADGHGLSETFSTDTEIDLDTNRSSSRTRDFTLEVKSGHLSQALSTVAETLETYDLGPIAKMPKGRFAAGDSAMTQTANMISPTTLEMKVKIESADADGRYAKYARFLFERQ